MYFGSEKDLLFVRYHPKKLFDKKDLLRWTLITRTTACLWNTIMMKILGLDQHNIRLDMLQDLVLH